MSSPGIPLDLVSLALGAGVGGAVILGFGLRPYLRLTREKAVLEARLDAVEGQGGDHFRALAQDALNGIQENFLLLANEKFKNLQNNSAHDLEKRHIAIADMVKPLEKHLQSLSSAVEQMKGTDQALREDLKSLSRETSRLAGALRDPTAQGRWGEYVLEGLMENSGLIKGVHYETQETLPGTGLRPDMIINLSNTLRIVVDAKTPLNQFADSLAHGLNEDETAQVMKDLAAQVRSHIAALSRKGYWENLDADSVDFTVLFLPSEALFSMALRGDSGLADLAASKNVIIASPTLIMALMRIVRMGWRQVDLANNARAISEQGGLLYQRLGKFIEHFEKIGKNLSSAIDGYNGAVGSLDRMVVPAARKLQELGVEDGGRKIAEVAAIEAAPRRLTGTENI